MRKQGATWKQVGDIYDTDGENVRAFAKKHERFGEIREEEKITDAVKEVIDKRTEDRKTGEVTNEIKRRMREKKVFTDDELLELHALDPDKFKIRVVTSNEWTMTESGGEQYYNFQSKIVAEPKAVEDIDWDELGERLADRVTPKQPKEPQNVDDERYLVIPMYDLHFGANSIEDYDDSLAKIYKQLETEYKRVLIISGGDILDSDNHQSTTASGTQLETTDLNQAWDDAFDFFDLIIDKALDYAEEVELLYVPGNHDYTSGQTLFKPLNRLYRDEDRLTINDEQESFKATLLGSNFIGATHGIKRNKKDYPMIFATQFSQIWGAEGVHTREVYTGHLHFEHTVDMNGLVIRQMPTRNEENQWSRDNGFMGSHKRFMLIEYSEHGTEMIRYV